MAKYIKQFICKIVFPFILVMACLHVSRAAPIQYPNYRSVYVNDFANVLDAEDEQQLSEKLKQFRNSYGVEFTVVTIKAMQDYGFEGEIEDFATGLFNDWGVGNAEKNNGIMMIVAVNNRQMRIEVGKGYGKRLDRPLKRMIDSVILPRFKNENYPQGIINGAEETIELAIGPDQRLIGEKIADRLVPNANELVQFLVVTGVIFGVAIIVMVGGLFLILMIARGIIIIIYRAFTAHRRFPSKCEKCGRSTKAASPERRMKVLNSGQIAEENCGSVIYKTWQCKSCDRVTIKRYPAFFPNYQRCPKCEFHTLKVNENELKAATSLQDGLGERISQCIHCDYFHQYQFTIPRENTKGISTSSESSSSSFGGGSSSGGGASGRW